MVTIVASPNITLANMLICTVITAISADAFAQTSLMEHRVFAKYPSPADLQRRVDDFIREQPREFAMAREDFDVAVRSGLQLRWPKPTRPRPRKIDKWPLVLPVLRAAYEFRMARTAKRAGLELLAEFYKEHMDELSLTHTPALRVVSLHVILNGWHDWSAWSTDRLKGYRERYPDIYRIAAISLIKKMNEEIGARRMRGDAAARLDGGLRATGLFLRMLLNSNQPYELRRELQSTVMRIHGDRDALDFVVRLALQGESETARRNGRYCMGALTGSLPLEQQRDFWVQYLDCDDDQIRSAAVEKVGGTIDLLKKDAEERSTNDELADRLRAIAATDPDPRIRAVAQRRITAYEDDSPPPGLIDYATGTKEGTIGSAPK